MHHLLDRIFHHQKISKETLPEFLEFIGIQLLDKHRTGFFCWTVLPGLLFVFDYSQVKNCQTRAIILPTQPAVATGAVRVPQADVSQTLCSPPSESDLILPNLIKVEKPEFPADLQHLYKEQL